MDIVYFVRDGKNEELRYSLRSLYNLEHDKVWMYGGPEWVRPDRLVRVAQVGATKWDKVRNMYRLACKNNEISEDFILMNDDFFIMKPTTIPTAYRATLEHHILEMEMKFDRITPYTRLLRGVYRTLAGKPTLSYDLHIPMVLNRKKLLYLLDKYPDCHAMRSLYGNYYEIGGVQMDDVKVYQTQGYFDRGSTFLSSSDESWNGVVGEFIKSKFREKSRYESW